MSSRHKAREKALQSLFQEDFREVPFSNRIETTDEGGDFTQKLVNGVFLHYAEIDQIIEDHTEHWSSERMTLIDRNVLRIAVFELLFLRETPPRVVLNEAIEVAKAYGTEKSGAFVNGVLDAIAAGDQPVAQGVPKP